MNPDASTGQYVDQGEGSRAFVSNSLPPNPPIRLKGDTQVLLSQANIALGRLDGSIQTLPNPDIHVGMYLLKEALMSSQLEGKQCSLAYVLTEEVRTLSRPRFRYIEKVFNYISATNHGLELLKYQPFSLDILQKTHAWLMAGTPGLDLSVGEWRQTRIRPGPPGSRLHPAAYSPPRYREIPGAMRELESFLSKKDTVPLLLRIAYVHAQLAAICPFYVGNDQIGRLLITLMLSEDGTLAKPVLYLSQYFSRHRQRYYYHLQGVRDHGGWESWLAFFLRGVIEVSEQATPIARDILKLRERDRQTIDGLYGTLPPKGHRLLEVLFERPFITVSGSQDLIGLTYSSTKTLIDRFVEKGILNKLTGRGNFQIFQYTDYVNLFTDEPWDNE